MSAPEWKGLFEWSMKYHDGTRPTDFSSSEVDPEKLKWLEEVLQHYMKDFVDRMKEIKDVFDGGENVNTTIAEKEALLDELQDIVESVDHAKNLHIIGGLQTLLEILECPFPSLRQKTAEVVSTCVQNNLPVQKWFLEGGVLPHLMNLLEDENEQCCAKGWLAISSLVRNFADGEREFIAAGGLSRLLTVATGTNNGIRRRALFLLQYFLHSGSRSAVLKLNAVPIAAQSLASQDPDVKEAALMALVEAGRDSEGCSELKKVEGLSETVSRILSSISQLAQDEQEAVQGQVDFAEALQKLLEPGPTTQANCMALSVV